MNSNNSSNINPNNPKNIPKLNLNNLNLNNLNNEIKTNNYGKKNKKKNKRVVQEYINEELKNYKEQSNNNIVLKNSDSLNNISKSEDNVNNLNSNKNFYKNKNISKSSNNFKIREIKDSIRKSSSHNGDIFLKIDQQNNNLNEIKLQQSCNEEEFQNNKFCYLIGEDEINIEDNILNNDIKNEHKFQNLSKNVDKKSNENNKVIKNNINENIDYNLINTPFKIIGEELLNEEIRNKYKQKTKMNFENNQIIKKLRDIFKKLVYKELNEKPNISQILLDSEIIDDVKIKILRKYIKFTTEDEIFSNEADKIKIEIQNLIKQKKIRHSNDYNELGKEVETKIMPENLKIKLEDIYYRVIEGDQPKLHNMINNLLKLPFERKLNILDSMHEFTHEKKIDFIKSIYTKLDKDLYGLDETKDSIISWICQKINNPSYNSIKYLCLCGPAGVGKTSIIHSISECLNIPYSYISLANIYEPSSLIGHGYTYEGSQYGSIANGLIKNGCTNGILLFDELDKTKEKVQNTLLGIFDPLQNTKFIDAYFGEFYLNLSESMIIVCLNDLSKINPILKDRLHLVNIPGYSLKEKKIIIKKYILPKYNQQYNVEIMIEEKVFDEILEKTKHFEGIRQIQMYIIKIYELIVLDKYTNKYNFDGVFSYKNINLLKIIEQSNTYSFMFS